MWFSLKLQHWESKATLHSLHTVNWSIGTDCFSFRERHVRSLWMLVSSLRHFPRKWFSLKLRHLESEATLHSLRTVNWSVGTNNFSFRETHMSFLWMLIISLRLFQRKVIFSETTAFRKWSKTPLTSHSELKCCNRLLLIKRNAFEFHVNAPK